MKKLVYVANVRMPSEKAHGIQIMEMCEAFSASDLEVELVVPQRKNHITQDIFSYYRLPDRFRVTESWTWDVVKHGRLGFLLEALIFSLVVVLRLLLSRERPFVYSRDDIFLYIWSFTGKPYAYEIHAPKQHFISRRVIKKAQIVFVISKGLRDYYLKQGVPDTHMVVAPDGVNLGQFVLSQTKEECRKQCALPLDRKIALYAGHLYVRKGAQVFAEAARAVPDTLCVFIGGTEKDIASFRNTYGNMKNVCILGHCAHEQIPYYLRAADVLILPNSGQDADARLFTSPMKLFEYMASGTPIIASDVSSLREILDEQSALFVHPDDPSALADQIKKVFQNTQDATEKAKRARSAVERFSWDQRAKVIMNGIQHQGSQVDNGAL